MTAQTTDLMPGQRLRIDGIEVLVRATDATRVLVQWPTGHGEWVAREKVEGA